jgi:NAD(P)H-flavin reductase
MRGKNLVFVGSGIGMAPLRSLLWHCIDTRRHYGDITLIYGARSTADLLYKADLEEWSAMPDVHTVLTVDPGGVDGRWQGEVGFVPTTLEKVQPSPLDSVAVTSAPPIIIKFVLLSLAKIGFAAEQIITTLETKMKCGLGKCGRCNVGYTCVCEDGPVFNVAELERVIEEY